MNKRFVAISLCLVMAFPTANAMAQGTAPANQSWEVLRQIPIGENLQVEKRDGKKSRGRLVSCSDAELQLERKGKIESVSRNDVKKVWSIAPPSRTKKAVFGGIGAVGGFVAGLLIAVWLGLKQCGGSCADERTGIIAAPSGLLVAGALAGRALARGKRTLIYSMP